jgi:hypothetical protein
MWRLFTATTGVESEDAAQLESSQQRSQQIRHSTLNRSIELCERGERESQQDGWKQLPAQGE